MVRNRGFTLIELMISILLMMIVMLMINQMFSSANMLYKVAAERTEVFSQGRLALDVIDTDLQRINPQYGDLTLASHEAQNVFEEGEIRSVPLQLEFTRLPMNDDTDNIVPLLAFYTTTSWQAPKDGGYESGPAQVVYYLRKRPERILSNGTEVKLTGGYLMRRVVPYRVFSTRRNVNASDTRDLPPEEEVASSVLSARIYAFNNGAPAYMMQTGKEFPVASYLGVTPQGSARVLSDKGENTPQQPGAGGVGLGVLFPARPHPGRTYSFGYDAGSSPENLSTRESFPLYIAVELTFVNDSFDIFESEFTGTVRTVSRVMAVPNAQPAVFLNDNDILKFTD